MESEYPDISKQSENNPAGALYNIATNLQMGQ